MMTTCWILLLGFGTGPGFGFGFGVGLGFGFGAGFGFGVGLAFVVFEAARFLTGFLIQRQCTGGVVEKPCKGTSFGRIAADSRPFVTIALRAMVRL